MLHGGGEQDGFSASARSRRMQTDQLRRPGDDLLVDVPQQDGNRLIGVGGGDQPFLAVPQLVRRWVCGCLAHGIGAAGRAYRRQGSVEILEEALQERVESLEAEVVPQGAEAPALPLLDAPRPHRRFPLCSPIGGGARPAAVAESPQPA